MTQPKIQHPDDRSRVWVAPLFRRQQVEFIGRICQELSVGTMAALDASDMGVGKTAVAAQSVVNLGLRNVLYVGIKDMFDEWSEVLSAQSDGSIVLRRMDTTAAGRAAFADFRAGMPGHYFAGSQFLGVQDWTRVPVLANNGEPTFTIDTAGKVSAGNATFSVDSNGGAWPTTPVTKRKHLGVYKKLPTLDLIVYDEVHVAANRISNAIGTIRSIPTKRKLALSGTFFGNKFPGAHTITRWLWPTVLTESNEFLIDPSIVRWRDQWCATETPIGPNGKPVAMASGKRVQKVTGEKNPGEFVSTLPLYLRAESPIGIEPGPELIYVDLSPEERRDYDQMLEEGVAWLSTHPGIEPIVANLPISKRARLRTATLGTLSLRDGEIYFHMDTQSSKMFALRSLLERPDWKGRQVAIYTESKRYAKVLVERMRRGGFNAAEWSGDVTSAKRRQLKKDFLSGDVQYIVAVISAFGTGLNGFQRVCNRVAWVSESENAKDNVQAIRRFWRLGGDLEDFQHAKILARETIDDEVESRNRVNTGLNRLTMKLVS